MVNKINNRGGTRVHNPAAHNIPTQFEDENNDSVHHLTNDHENLKIDPRKKSARKRRLGPTLQGLNNHIDKDENAKQEQKRRKKEAQDRKGARQSFMYQQRPDAHDKGLAGQIAHLSGLTAEGLAGEAFADIMVFVLQFTFNTNYLQQCATYQAAKDQQVGIIATEKEHLRAGRHYYQPDPTTNEWPDIYRLNAQGNPIRDDKHLIPPQCATEHELNQNGYFKRGMRLIYEPDENGILPVTYAVDPSSGSLDYQNTIEGREATPFEQIANGFVPNPSLLQGYTNVLYQHMERMSGFGSLSPEAKMWLYGSLGQDGQGEGKEKDIASDLASIKPPVQAKAAGPGPGKG